MAKKHYNHLLPKPHIRTTDFVGKEPTLTIKDWGHIEVYDRKTRGDVPKGVLYFEETPKYMICNATRLEQIAKILGSDYLDDWIGQRVKLYVDTNIKVGGKTEDGIRVKAPAAGKTPGENIEELGFGAPIQTKQFDQMLTEAAEKAGLDAGQTRDILFECNGDYEQALGVVLEQYTPPAE